MSSTDRTTAFLGGRIHTMDGAGTVATGLVATGGRIIAIGDAAEIEAALPADAERIALAGRVALPGFVDAHCHLELTTTHLSYAVQCFAPPHRTLADVCAAMAERARATPAGEWVVGRANFFLENWVEDKRPLLRADLDAGVPHHPAAVFSGIHVCTLNTKALEASGLANGPPPRGVTVDVENGRATEVWGRLPLPRYGVEATATAIGELGRSMFQSRGVTTIAEIPYTSDGIHAFQHMRRRGNLPARIGLWYHLPRLCSIDELIATGLESGFGDEWLRLGGVKLFVDGAGVDAWGRPEVDLQWDPDELEDVVGKAHAAGLQLWMHVAPTRPAAELALTTLERAIERLPRPDHRHRIEHMGDLKPDRDLLLRARRLGVIPLATPQFTFSYGDADPDTACTPLRTLHDLGFRIPGSSDCTGTQPEAANPFHGIWCAMAHRTRGGETLAPDERIDLDAALRMFTADAAFGCHFDDRGTLEVGKLADLVVLGRDPWTVPVDELPEIPVDLTVIGGRTVHPT